MLTVGCDFETRFTGQLDSLSHVDDSSESQGMISYGPVLLDVDAGFYLSQQLKCEFICDIFKIVLEARIWLMILLLISC